MACVKSIGFFVSAFDYFVCEHINTFVMASENEWTIKSATDLIGGRPRDIRIFRVLTHNIALLCQQEIME